MWRALTDYNHSISTFFLKEGNVSARGGPASNENFRAALFKWDSEAASEPGILHGIYLQRNIAFLYKYKYI